MTNITHSKIWSLVWPLIFANLSIPLLGLTDTFVLGQLPDSRPIAALIIGTKIFEFALFLMYFLSIGTTTLVAQSLAVDNSASAQLWGLRSSALGLFFGLLLVPILWLVSPAWIDFLGARPATAELAAEYVKVCLIGVPAQVLTQSLMGWLFGNIRTSAVMKIIVISNCLNIILTLWFVLQLEQGVTGAALGTAISQWLGLAIALYYSKDQFNIPFAQLKNVFDLLAIKRLFSTNRDLFIRSACILGFLQCLTRMSSEFYAPGIAAMGVIMTLLMGSVYLQESVVKATETLVARVYLPTQPESFLRLSKQIKIWFIGAIILICAFYSVTGGSIIEAITKDLQTQLLAKNMIPYLLIYISIASWCYYYNAILIGLGAFSYLRDAYLLSFIVLLFTMWWYFYQNPSFERLWFTAYIFEACRLTSLKLSVKKVTNTKNHSNMPKAFRF